MEYTANIKKKNGRKFEYTDLEEYLWYIAK